MCSNFAAVSALVPIAEELTLRQLVFWPLAVNCGLLTAEAVLALLPALGGKAVMLVTVYSAGITGATTACLQAGSFVVASRFPALYMQVMCSITTSARYVQIINAQTCSDSGH